MFGSQKGEFTIWSWNLRVETKEILVICFGSQLKYFLNSLVISILRTMFKTNASMNKL